MPNTAREMVFEDVLKGESHQMNIERFHNLELASLRQIQENMAYITCVDKLGLDL